MRVARSSRARAGCVTTCLVRLVAVLLLGGLAAVVIVTVVMVRTERLAPKLVGELANARSSQRAAYGPVTLLTGDAGEVGLLVFTARDEASPPALSYLSGDPLAVRWDSAALESGSIRTPPVIDADVAYLRDGERLLALNLPDGSRRWTAELGAAIPDGCASCVQPLEGAVAVLTADSTLRVLDAATGDLRWQTALDTTPRELHVIAGNPAIVTSVPETDNTALLIFDAAEGSLHRRIQPRCEADGTVETLTPDSPVLYDPSARAIYFLFGFEQQGCAQRWAATTGERVWSSSIPLSDVPWPRAWRTDGPLLSSSAIYLAGENGTSLLAVDTQDGSVRVIYQTGAYALDPWAQDGNVLLVHAERLDDVESDELWGIDLTTGERRWHYPIALSTSSWAAHRAARGFAVSQLLSNPPRLQVDILDAARGVPLRRHTLPVGSAAWTGTAWTDDTAWLTIGALYAVDLRTGIPAQVWPPEQEQRFQ